MIASRRLKGAAISTKTIVGKPTGLSYQTKERIAKKKQEIFEKLAKNPPDNLFNYEKAVIVGRKPPNEIRKLGRNKTPPKTKLWRRKTKVVNVYLSENPKKQLFKAFLTSCKTITLFTGLLNNSNTFFEILVKFIA